MRIGTWNLNAKWTTKHADTLADADCDVWLLTEVDGGVDLPGYTLHRSRARMSPGQHYAGVMTRASGQAQTDLHPASAAVRCDETIFCSSVLPWSSKDDSSVWGLGDQGERTRRTVKDLESRLVPGKTVWGGDFNHALQGPTRWAGSTAGRDAICEVAGSLGLTMATDNLPHRRPGICSIDHIGVPADWTVFDAIRIDVAPTLSDHDAYVVSAGPT